MNRTPSPVTMPGLTALCALLALPGGALAQDSGRPNTFGMPGLIDMPTADSFVDADLGVSVAVTGDQLRNTLTFQILPRLTGAFRYSRIDDFLGPGLELYDRSFDLHYRLVDEGRLRPSVAVGLRDFAGTGVFSSEYLVASKTLVPGLQLSGGIGWGTLGTKGSFDNPLGALSGAFDRRAGFDGQGGEPNLDNWFRGPAALFGGIRWQASERLTLSAEYSSDDRSRAPGPGADGLDSPVNLGLQYRWAPGSILAAQYLHGEAFGLSAHFTLNPRKPPYGGDTSPAPMPVLHRGDVAASWAGAITQDAIPSARRTSVVRSLLEAEGIELDAIALDGDRVRVRIRNTRYDAHPQAIGRTARVLALTMPAATRTFEIELMRRGLPVTRVSLKRATLEALETAPDAIPRSLAATTITAGRDDLVLETLPEDRLSWSIGPYLGLSLFDPDNPVRADLGVQVAASYAFTPRLTLSGAVRGKVIGNRDQTTRSSDSVLPRVRTNRNLYDEASDVWLQRLTLDHVGRLSDDIYTRVSLGYLEEMFAGLSGEVLWKPVDSRLALGLEVNHVFQRDNDRLFGIGDYGYEVTTGHVSAYYAMANGFDVQLDLGRYLAGDWGGTIGIDRRFGNGWSVGAFATLTDVPFEDFGEGSFDKGIRFSVPLAWALGSPSRMGTGGEIRPIQRDGGARLAVGGRLYPTVRDLHAPELGDQWGRFWR
jgi:hypothetical protein